VKGKKGDIKRISVSLPAEVVDNELLKRALRREGYMFLSEYIRHCIFDLLKRHGYRPEAEMGQVSPIEK